MPTLHVGVFAPSSVVPPVELELGVEKLRRHGLEVKVDECCTRQHHTFAGSDAERAGSLWDMARDDEINVVWAARGGYGATRILPLLEQWTNLHGVPPRKLLVGYSDVTALHEFVRTRWGWKTLHAVMVGGRQILELSDEAFSATLALVRGERPRLPWVDRLLQFVGARPEGAIEGELVGGNLTVWNAMSGTPFMPAGAERILFLEDVGEPWYRVDRMLTQLAQSGGLRGVRAIVLGDFVNCDDDPPTGMISRSSLERGPVRPRLTAVEAMAATFGALSIPVAGTLPVGHGAGLYPLPLGGKARLSPQGLLEWWGWE